MATRKEEIIAQSAMLQRKSEELYYLQRNLTKYKTELAAAWNDVAFSFVANEIDDIIRQINRVSANIEDLSNRYRKFGLMKEE